MFLRSGQAHRRAESALLVIGLAAWLAWATSFLLLSLGFDYLPIARSSLTHAVRAGAHANDAVAVALFCVGLAWWISPRLRGVIAKFERSKVVLVGCFLGSTVSMALLLATREAWVVWVALAAQAALCALTAPFVARRLAGCEPRLRWVALCIGAMLLAALVVCPLASLFVAFACLLCLGFRSPSVEASPETPSPRVPPLAMSLLLAGGALFVIGRSMAFVTTIGPDGQLVEAAGSWPLGGAPGFAIAKILVPMAGLVLSFSAFVCTRGSRWGCALWGPTGFMSLLVTWPAVVSALSTGPWGAGGTGSVQLACAFVFSAVAAALLALARPAKAGHRSEERREEGLLATALTDLGLSERESRVMLEMRGGASVSSMASHMGVSRSTVGSYCQRAYGKLGVDSRAAALVRLEELAHPDGRKESRDGRRASLSVDARLRRVAAWLVLAVSAALLAVVLVPWSGSGSRATNLVFAQVGSSALLVAAPLAVHAARVDDAAGISGIARGCGTPWTATLAACLACGLALLCARSLGSRAAEVLAAPGSATLAATAYLGVSITGVFIASDLVASAGICKGREGDGGVNVPLAPSPFCVIGFGVSGVGVGLLVSWCSVVGVLPLNVPLRELVVWGLSTVVLLGAMVALALLARCIGVPAHATGAAPAAALLTGLFFSERVVLVMRGYGWDALMPLLGIVLMALGVIASVAHRRTLLRRQGLWDLTDEELSRRAVEEWGFGRSQSQVAVLAARGLSRAQIAEELTISRTTVNAHLRLVYQRLGIHSRDELSLVFSALAKTK